MKQTVAAISLAALLVGCATPYQEMGWSGGLRVTRTEETTFLIEARGNAFTSPAQIQAYAMRRAAEETVKDGYEVFTFVGMSDETRHGTIYTPGTTQSFTNAQITGVGQTAYGTAQTTSYSTPGGAYAYSKPGLLLTVSMSRGPCPTQKVPFQHCAADVLKFMEPPAK